MGNERFVNDFADAVVGQIRCVREASSLWADVGNGRMVSWCANVCLVGVPYPSLVV